MEFLKCSFTQYVCNVCMSAVGILISSMLTSCLLKICALAERPETILFFRVNYVPVLTYSGSESGNMGCNKFMAGDDDFSAGDVSRMELNDMLYLAEIDLYDG